MQETFSDWTLVTLSPLGIWGLIAAGLLAIVAALLVIWTYREAKRPWLLIVARLLSAILLIGLLTEPAIQLRVVRKVKNRVALIIDRSLSMTLATPNGATRYDALQKLLKDSKEQIEQLNHEHVIEWYDLDGPINSKTLNDIPSGETTDLIKALENAKVAGSGKPLAGIVLFSDGADNAGLEGVLKASLSSQSISRLQQLNAPVNTINLSGTTFSDIGIVDVRADEFAFVHNTFSVEITLVSSGFDGIAIPVTLKRDGKVITVQSVALKKNGTTRLTLKSKPDKIGEYVYSISVPILAGEAIVDNNERSFVVTVIRDKIRVLQVVGKPSWDERFLRQLLKENPNVDLISFFILRTPSDVSAASESELSLIPFPVDKLFTTELRSFDVVILQDFDHRPYPMAQYLSNIRDAVRNSGLGLLMIGGDESFADGGYANTEIAEILPVRLDHNGMINGPIPLILTKAGRVHPVTDLTYGSGTNENAWQALPPLAAINNVGWLAAGATALLISPRDLSASGPIPIIAVTDAGLGRSMIVATNSMWRWRFSSSQDGGASERAYYRFWSNALRWLVRDPEHARIRVTPEHRRNNVGSPIEVSISVLDSDYQPVSGANLQITLSSTKAGTLQRDHLTTSEGGVIRKTYNNLPTDAYHLNVEASLGVNKLGVGQGVFIIEAYSQELTQATPRPDLLAAIAETTKGRNFDSDTDLWSHLKLTNPEVVEVDRRRNIEIWDNAWALILIIAVLALDWSIRRRRGYV
ncbi:MAG: hypothetical protein JW841_03045 [Deltaproteobacteria bacterium]|nr:hypothetical protein [Deltaproteobacteria bacterium]